MAECKARDLFQCDETELGGYIWEIIKCCYFLMLYKLILNIYGIAILYGICIHD